MANEIMHYGIMGMKWGVRRYQNPDGSLTAAGRLRYGSSENLRASYAKKEAKKEHKTAYKNRHTMTNEELQDSIKRLQLEKQLKDLTEQDITKGESAIKRILSKSAESAATSIATAAFTNAGKYAIKKTIGVDISKADLGKDKDKKN